MTGQDAPEAPAPEARPRGLMRGNVLWLSVASFLNDAASEMIYPLLPLFLTGTLGVGAAFVGVVEGVAESASSLLKLASGWLADRTGRRKAPTALGYAIAALGRPLIAVTAAGWQVLAVRLADRVGKGIRTAPRDALLAESVPAEQRGAAFGLHRAADHAGAVAGPLIASAMLLAWPGNLRTVFALAIIPGLLTVGAVMWKVRETAPASPATSAPPLPRWSELGPTLPRYLAVLALFTLGNASDAFLLLRAAEAGVPVAAIPLLWGALHVSKAVFSIWGGRLSDRIGARRAIVAGWMVYAAVYAGFAVVGAAWQVWALFLVYGLYFGLTEAPEKALVAALAPEGRRGSAFGAYHAAIGIAALPASVLFGVLWQVFGAHVAFAVGAAFALAAALLLPWALPRER
ncbi:MAG TPA: MFS transporter [Longimicrobium sp.]|jgi:MFS family permease|uniref:MFS transporter n=1 Tax=Longimicrobium sp. TaxID=2029185 RepID=UPI002ED9EFC1